MSDYYLIVRMANYLEDYAEKLSMVSIDANRYLRHIRELDRRVNEMHKELSQSQKELIEKVKSKRMEPKAIEE